MIRKLKILLLSNAVLLVSVVQQASAQCAMCRATVENNVSAGESSIGAGLNAGILYLMVIPYLALAVVGYAWYRHSKKHTEGQLKIARLLKSRFSS